MIREQGDLLSQYIMSHLFTHGAIYSLWMARLPQDQKFRGEKASHSTSLLGTYRLVRISSRQLSLRLTTCKALHEQIMFIIFLTTLWWQYHLTEEEIKTQKWQKKKKNQQKNLPSVIELTSGRPGFWTQRLHSCLLCNTTSYCWNNFWERTRLKNLGGWSNCCLGSNLQGKSEREGKEFISSV